jgi:hypothetical protein
MCLVYVIGKENSESFFMPAYTHASAGDLRELNNDVNTIGTGSVCVVASRVSISHGCPASFYNAVWTSTSYTAKHSALGQKN